jgi:preprotein translocase subunit SecD
MWKRLQTPLRAVVIVAIVALAIWQTFPLQKKIHLGLDLQGGVRVLLQLTPSKEVPTITPEVLSQVEQVVQNRVNGLGVAEPVISQSGSDRLLVELPKVKDPGEVEKLLKEAAVLDFKIVPPAVNQRALADPKYANDPNGAYKDAGPVVYSGADLKAAQAAFGPGGQPQINFQTKDPGKFGKLTAANINNFLGIFLDKKYVEAAVINGVITSDGDITGRFTEEETIRLSNELNAGALPVPVTIIENDAVGPILGAIDLQKSLVASMVGLGLVLVFMIVVYRLPGFLADVALVIYVLLMLGLFAFSGAVLTLPGIAGFVLSIGMAVDANVLIFERLKEELWAGKSLRQSVKVGFSRAFSSVFDSHFTTIVGAGALYVLGTGTVKGFAFTLFWGTVFSLVTAVFVTRTFTDAVVDNNVAPAPALYGA